MFFRMFLLGAGLALTACGGRIEPADTESTTPTPPDTTNLPPGTSTGTGTGGGFSCHDGPDAVGPWAGDFPHPISAASSTVTDQPYTHDAGVGALLAATAGNEQDTVVDLVVSGAIVTARGYVPDGTNDGTVSFWFEDASGPMYAYRMDLLGVDPATLSPGDEVSFRASLVKEYFGTPELLEVQSFQIVSSGNPVHVVDGMGGALDWAVHGLYNVEVYGEIVAGPTDCSSDCWDLQYGDETVTFRTGSGFQAIGDCIHWIGPLGQFGMEEQLDADDYDWYRWF